MTVDDKLWNFLIWSSLFISYLGYPKFALFYCVANEVFWEDEEEEEEIDLEENVFRENYDELDYNFIPPFFTPVYDYAYFYSLNKFRAYICFCLFFKKKFL